jgi:hypothetical protein
MPAVAAVTSATLPTNRRGQFIGRFLSAILGFWVVRIQASTVISRNHDQKDENIRHTHAWRAWV